MSEGGGFKPVKAKKVVIPGYEKFDLYLHHPASEMIRVMLSRTKTSGESVKDVQDYIWVMISHQCKLIGQSIG